MIVYATSAEAIKRYGEDYVIVSADRDNDAELDTDSFDQALADATNEVNGYLVGKVDLPADVTKHPQLVKYTIDIAIYNSCPTADVLTEQKVKRYDGAIRYLEHVASGKIKLAREEETGPEPATNTNQIAETMISVEVFETGTEDARRFSRTRMRSL